MGRYINLDSSGKNRAKLIRLIAGAHNVLIHQDQVDDNTRDMVAFISMALLEVSKTIDPTVEAWEKRGYWIKADRFRMEWSWTEKMGNKLAAAINVDNWSEIATLTAQLAEKLRHIKIPAKNRLGTPWTGAWERINKTG